MYVVNCSYINRQKKNHFSAYIYFQYKNKSRSLIIFLIMNFAINILKSLFENIKSNIFFEKDNYKCLFLCLCFFP